MRCIGSGRKGVIRSTSSLAGLPDLPNRGVELMQGSYHSPGHQEEKHRKMALEKDAPEIAQMTLDMGHIFRYSAKGEDEVTLEEEISIIKSYSRIQQMRFEGKISVYYFVSEDVLELKVMKMLLQPIVENSIFHGPLYLDTVLLPILEPNPGVGVQRPHMLPGVRALLPQHALQLSSSCAGGTKRCSLSSPAATRSSPMRRISDSKPPGNLLQRLRQLRYPVCLHDITPLPPAQPQAGPEGAGGRGNH